MDREEAIRKHYDAVAESYEKVSQQVDKILARLKIPAGASVLDVGCGTGNLTFRLPDRDSLPRVVGVDLSEGVLKVARDHAEARGLRNFEFLQANACRLPFSEEEFDVVVSNMVLHLVSDFGNALAEIARVVKPGGAAVLQFQGGGDIAPEMAALFHKAWTEILPGRPLPDLFNRITVEAVEPQLSAIGIENFEIAWRRVAMRIPQAKVDDWLSGFALVSGFWRCGVSAEAANRIELLLADSVRDEARESGYFLNTGNILLVEFVKASK